MEKKYVLCFLVRTDFLLRVVLLLLLLLLLLSFAAVLILGISLPIFDEFSVLFVRWFWAPFFSQVVKAVGVLVVPSVSDVCPLVERHFRLFA